MELIELDELNIKNIPHFKNINVIKSLVGDVICGGGSIRRLFSEPHKSDDTADIDLFFTNRNDLEKSVNHYLNNSTFYNTTQKQSNLLEFNSNNRKWQIIGKRIFSNTEDLFDDFDFTICQFAYRKNRFYSTKQAIEDLENKVLRPNGENIPHEYRWYKYIKLGFKPVDNIVYFKDHGIYCSYVLWGENNEPKILRFNQLYSIKENNGNIDLISEKNGSVLTLKPNYY